MTTAKITSKGQVTIPVEVRDRLGLSPGSRIAFVLTESGGFEIRPLAGSVRHLKGAVTPPAEPVTLEDMDDAIALGASGS